MTDLEWLIPFIWVGTFALTLVVVGVAVGSSWWVAGEVTRAIFLTVLIDFWLKVNA